MDNPRSIIDKIWDAHVVRSVGADAPDVLYVDLHLLHEVTSPQAFAELDSRRLAVRRPERCLATLDHAVPTTDPIPGGDWPGLRGAAARQVRALEESCLQHAIELCGRDHPARGIVHVMSAELGAAHPGDVVVCGDSHTSTHGAFGALAFGIGTTEVAHVLATQCVLQRRPKTMAVELHGELGAGVSAKDVALGMIGRIGAAGGRGFVLEYRGELVRTLDMEGRMTLCNMSIEAGARAGLISPDAKTIDSLRGRARAPRADRFEAAASRWRELGSDTGCTFDRSVRVDLGALAPQVTWGTSPDMVAPVDGLVPVPTSDAEVGALRYTRLRAEEPICGKAIDVVFVGSCTNGRLGDLRTAGRIMRGRRVANGVRMVVVPGSRAVQRAAEAEGLGQIFVDAGAEWRAPGCSMCIAMNGDVVGEGQRAISTSNRNFQGRQGSGAITHLASPATAAASAVVGAITDPRSLDH